MELSSSDKAAKGRNEVMIRKVWSHNLESEFNIVNSKLKAGFRFASLDTEFPGTVYPQAAHHGPPSYLYQCLKLNVDATNIIQFGFTLSNSQGDLPHIAGSPVVWEFNFKDFDAARGDLHNPDSIQLLKQQGVDFQMNTTYGIDSTQFAELFVKSGLLLCNVTWIGFHAGYDFGYLIKMLTRQQLPSELGGFMALIRAYFGTRVYDIKHMIKYCNGLYGGLDRVAKMLQVDRRAGKSHQAGSDSLLTMETFIKIKERYFGHMGSEQAMLNACAGVLFGLEVMMPPPPPPPIVVNPPPPVFYNHKIAAPVAYSPFGSPYYLVAY